MLLQDIIFSWCLCNQQNHFHPRYFKVFIFFKKERKILTLDYYVQYSNYVLGIVNRLAETWELQLIQLSQNENGCLLVTTETLGLFLWINWQFTKKTFFNSFSIVWNVPSLYQTMFKQTSTIRSLWVQFETNWSKKYTLVSGYSIKCNSLL